MIFIKLCKTKTQIAEIAALAKEIWTEHYEPIIGIDQVNYMLDKYQSTEAIFNQINNDDFRYYMAYMNGILAGYISVKLNNESKEIFLSKVYINKCFRHNGIFKEFIKLIRQLCEDNGLTSVWLTVNKNNHASIEVYNKTGFKIVEDLVSDIGNGFVMDDYKMKLDFTTSKTTFRSMRRKDREMDVDFAYSVIDNAEYGTLATVNDDGYPYCIPLSYARQDDKIYFHSALQGLKIENLHRDSRVCMSFVGNVKVPPEYIDQFTTEFESAVIFGEANLVHAQDEKITALKLISEKYCPEQMESFVEAVESSLKITNIVRIDINHITAKRKKYDSSGKEMKWGRR
jgi:nitroimidazol reductase NimA-like FMN-containing flavoprotein (pyridoxamine 5'-phosphate oxidase superfamily)/ribosomal protein S18 acetylase RimI-like enzyme